MLTQADHTLFLCTENSYTELYTGYTQGKIKIAKTKVKIAKSGGDFEEVNF